MLSRTIQLLAGRPHRDSVRKAARRQLQTSRLRQQQQLESTAAAAVAASASSTLTSSSSPHSLSAADARGSLPATEAAHTGAGDRLVEGNAALQRALTGHEPESRLQRDARAAVRGAETQTAALRTFFLLARADQREGVTAALLQDLTTTLLTLRTRQCMGTQAFALALADAGCTSDERWGDLQPDELRAFALYQARRLERYAEKGSAFSKASGFTVEGADNETVGLLEFQVHKYSNEVRPVSTDVLADLLHMDISWRAALRVYETARQLRGVDPPVEMTDRLMGLMTGYRSNGLGSRPWLHALQLYEHTVASGYETTLTTHALALDALWRAGDDFHRAAPSRALSAAERDRLWDGIMRVRDNVRREGGRLTIAGDEGCVFYESLVKAVAASGRTEAVLQVLQETEQQRDELSFRLLLPTAETYLFAMAACNAAGNAAHAQSLRELFQGHYTLRSAHSEALLVYLQSLQSVARTNGTIGADIEALVQDGKGLDRPCVVACLQLLAKRSVRPPSASKVELAKALYRLYDSNVWIQSPLARKVELQTVFRCCFLVDAEEGTHQGARTRAVVEEVRKHLRAVFGGSCAELEWLADTEVYGLETLSDWQEALAVYDRQVTQRPSEKIKFLPVPLRQVRWMLARALLRAVRNAARSTGGGAAAGAALDDGDGAEAGDFFFLEDDLQEDERRNAGRLAETLLSNVRAVYKGCPLGSMPTFVTAEMLLLKAVCSSNEAEKKDAGVEAMHQLALGSAPANAPRLLDLLSSTLGLTAEYAESVLVDDHAHLRATALTVADKSLRTTRSALEACYW